MSKQLIHYTLNGEAQEAYVDERYSLTDLIRHDHHLTGTKKGCEVGECGACTVLINGRIYDSCIYLALWADGKDIVTIEGIKSKTGGLTDIQQAFIDEAAVQCGFCTPGMIMTSVSILATGKRYTRSQLKEMIAGNFCRCTGYENILNAIERAMDMRDARQKEESISQ